MIDDGGLGEKVQNCFVQIVVLETHAVLKNVLNEVYQPQFWIYSLILVRITCYTLKCLWDIGGILLSMKERIY